jgi:hypothetical protein
LGNHIFQVSHYSFLLDFVNHQSIYGKLISLLRRQSLMINGGFFEKQLIKFIPFTERFSNFLKKKWLRYNVVAVKIKNINSFVYSTAKIHRLATRSKKIVEKRIALEQKTCLSVLRHNYFFKFPKLIVNFKMLNLKKLRQFSLRLPIGTGVLEDLRKCDNFLLKHRENVNKF